jgi:hypothetical protein
MNTKYIKLEDVKLPFEELALSDDELLVIKGEGLVSILVLTVIVIVAALMVIVIATVAVL